METPQTRRSMSWQSQANAARRQRGFVDASISLSQFEKWILDAAYKITTIPGDSWLKLCAVCPDWTLTRIESEVAALAYTLEEARKCDLHSLEQAEATVKQYAAGIRQRLSQIEEQTRNQWEPLQGVRQ